ncbi:MAG: hypothetical protein J6O39_05415 [Treponema sp.]|nr:hypothetical protein [Treponema sp.]
MAKSKDYFGLSRLLSLILAIIPFTAWLLGFLTRASEGKILAAILRIFFGWIVWIIDLFCMLTKGKIWRALNC